MDTVTGDTHGIMGDKISTDSTSELGSRNIISSDGQWTLPTRSHMPTILDPPIDVYKFGSTPDATDPKRGNAKIAMLTLNTPNIHLYSDLATINQKAYAEKHGYDFYVYKDSTLGWEMEKGSWDSIVTWNKVNAIPRHLHDHEWMFWIDSDAVFTNMSIKLESFIERAVSVVTSAEQNQLIKLLGHIDAKRENWQLFEECDFNCLPKNRFPGVFIVHYMGHLQHKAVHTRLVATDFYESFARTSPPYTTSHYYRHWPNEKRAALIKENVALGLMTEPDAAKDEL
ncbi:hypothetical protein SARC_05903 [Sphaeroforma arctica JP610]|uniref:Galactosyl transferase GMA12/MNN10 family protein n=1 Tax=Sphaeroforma arctica JP610 TaxID=667725 RepID=A0A0L0G0R4_9EUKA|nr:hypothetical protein SARC_05903 [Sphaeroforma arctica JP610]KNC81798.1 hypothetical protein SARC_05903 [Sphaeroforma arctica JP610]|eukprot:XP_014155700.1 hypothetical protein SARC_05903 [Sphaeroforma arctica JP610]